MINLQLTSEDWLDKLTTLEDKAGHINVDIKSSFIQRCQEEESFIRSYSDLFHKPGILTKICIGDDTEDKVVSLITSRIFIRVEAPIPINILSSQEHDSFAEYYMHTTGSNYNWFTIKLSDDWTKGVQIIGEAIAVLLQNNACTISRECLSLIKYVEEVVNNYEKSID